MPRPNVSTAMQTWLGGAVLPAAFFFEGTFASGTVYLWSGFGSITWNGQTWTGIGTLGKVTPISEGVKVEAKGITVALSGFDPNLLADVMGEMQFGQPMTLYIGGFNDGTLIDNPIAAFVGLLDKPTVSMDRQGNAMIAIACENPFLSLNAPADRRYTEEDQARYNPGDLAMTFVTSIQEKTFYVGSAPTTQGNI